MCRTYLIRFIQGDGDSEIALVVEDEDMIESAMDGEPYQAARFAATLRRKLYRGLSTLSHLGSATLLTIAWRRASWPYPAPVVQG